MTTKEKDVKKTPRKVTGCQDLVKLKSATDKRLARLETKVRDLEGMCSVLLSGVTFRIDPRGIQRLNEKDDGEDDAETERGAPFGWHT